MGYVFISYSTKNQLAADSIHNLLKANKVDTWMAPGDIPAGEKYGAVINKTIKNCSCVLLLLTKDSIMSKWVPKEIERAINYGKPIIPVKLEEVILNDEFEFYISTDHLVSLPKIDETSLEFKKILGVIRSHVSSDAEEYPISEVTADAPAPSPASPVTKENFSYYFKMYLYSSIDSCLLVYSHDKLDSSERPTVCFDETAWNALRQAVTELFSVILGLDPSCISVTKTSSLGNIKCTDRSTFDEEYRFNFRVSFIGKRAKAHFDEFHLTLEDDLKLSLFKKGNYIHKYHSKKTPLSKLGIDEARLTEKAKGLIELAHPNESITVAPSFEARVYADKSGSFVLEFLEN